MALALSANAAETAHSMNVSVPFPFVVAGQSFDPGDYRVSESDSGVVTVQGNGKAAVVISLPEGEARGEAPSVRFTSNASREYLSGVIVDGAGIRSVPVHAFEERKLTVGSK